MLKSNLKGISSDEINKQIEKLLREPSEKKTEKKRPSTIIKPVENFDTVSKQLTLNDFLQHHDEEFVKFAYRAILRREPDPEGFNYYLTNLRNGTYTKIDIITRLRFSREGRKKAVKIKGLLPKAVYSVLAKRPIIGHILQTLKILAKLPLIEQRLNVVENNIYPQLLKINHELTLTKNHIAFIEAKIGNEINKIEEELKIIDGLNKELNKIYNKLEKINEELRKNDIPDILIEPTEYPVRKDLPYYLAFEELFRGEEYTVKTRQKIYLDYIPKDTDKPVLDIGAGRGEFLELLRENGIHHSIGIDIDSNSVDYMKNKGLQAIHSDAVAYLKDSKNMFRAITAFHVVEHMDIEKQKQLFRLSYERLEKKGLFIIETPNPWFIYGFGSFYIDQTHIKPIPPETVVFLFQWIGFKNIKVLYLNSVTKQIPKDMPKKIYYPDYAVIGEKS